MKELLTKNFEISPLQSDSFLEFGSIETKKDDFELLLELHFKEQFPSAYIDFLNMLEKEECDLLSNKFLKIFLYATSKVNDRQDLKSWLLKAPLPTRNNYGIDSMSQLSVKITGANQINRKINNALDKINETREKMKNKSDQKLLKSLDINLSKYNSLTSELENSVSEINDMIFEIESNLASGKML
jgi:hypothetical protein